MANKEKTEAVTKKNKKWIFITLGVILLIVAGASFWLYTGETTNAKRTVFKTLPLPLAKVGTEMIYSNDFFSRLTVASLIYNREKLPTTSLEQDLLNQLINLKKIEVLAKQNHVSVTNQEIEDSYQAFLSQSGLKSEDDLESKLKDQYHLSIGSFKEEVLKQKLIQDKLNLWFNGQERLNQESFILAREVLAKLENGENFEEVAKKYTQDYGSKDFAGDGGFVPYQSLLPEFREAVKELSINQRKLVISRYGLHIVQLNAVEESPESEENKSYNLQQIFIKPGDFGKWLESESQAISTIKFLQ